MNLVTVETYRLHTCELSTASEAVTGALADAQRLIEGALDRPLDYTTSTTETLVPYRDEWRALCVAPRRVPCISVPDGSATVRAGERELVNVTSMGVFLSATYWQDADSHEPRPVDVTFEGGWKPRGSTDHVLPVDLERALCFVAQGLLRESALVGVTGGAGVVSATVGDVSVTFDGAAGEGLDRYAAGVTDVLELYRYRPYP